MIGSLTQGHLLPMVAPATILRRVGRVDFDQHSASFFRFARELLKEGRPCRVTDAFGQTRVMKHSVHMKVFDTNGSELIDDLSTLLMGEVLPFPLGTFMHTR